MISQGNSSWEKTQWKDNVDEQITLYLQLMLPNLYYQPPKQVKGNHKQVFL